MIQANELRIGNWVSFKQTADMMRAGWYWGEVKAVGEKSVQIKDYILSTNFDLMNDINPLPITREWVEKFGFKKAGETAYRLDHVVVNLRNPHPQGSTYRQSYVWFHGACIPNTIYVHQLQNAFYILAGQELTLHAPQENNTEPG